MFRLHALQINAGGEEVSLDGDVARRAVVLLLMRRRGRRGRLGRRANPGPVRRAAEARVAGLVGRDGRGRREKPREGQAVGGGGVGPGARG